MCVREREGERERVIVRVKEREREAIATKATNHWGSDKSCQSEAITQTSETISSSEPPFFVRPEILPYDRFYQTSRLTSFFTTTIFLGF